MEPKTEAELTRPGAVHTVVKILYGQWRQDLPGLTSVLRNDSSARFDRIVKIIRDPRDQAISSFFYNFFTLAQPGAATDEQLDEVVALVRDERAKPANDLLRQPLRRRESDHALARLFERVAHDRKRSGDEPHLLGFFAVVRRHRPPAALRRFHSRASCTGSKLISASRFPPGEKSAPTNARAVPPPPETGGNFLPPKMSKSCARSPPTCSRRWAIQIGTCTRRAPESRPFLRLSRAAPRGSAPSLGGNAKGCG